MNTKCVLLIIGAFIKFSYSKGEFPEISSRKNQNDHQQRYQRMSNLPTCDPYWSIKTDSERYGALSIPYPDREKNVIRIVLTLAARLPSRNSGKLSLVKDERSAVDDIDHGLPILYRVEFPLQNPVPKLIAIFFNERLICTSLKEEGPVTTIKLTHTIFTGLTGYSNRPVSALPIKPLYQSTATPMFESSYAPTTQTAKKSTSKTTQIQTSTTTKQPIEQKRFEEHECGVPLVKAPASTSLFVAGKAAIRGQFPWLAAYFHNGHHFNGFICGGSLVSTNIVVTAANCVEPKRGQPRKEEEATFYLGRYNLIDLNERFYIQSSVSEFIVHPDWKTDETSFDADIAIAILMRTIEFNKFIQPICLWAPTKPHNDLVGIVAGWGKTEIGAISTEKPIYGELTMVSEGDCLRSNVVFSSITSIRTFCAGNKDGGGPCNGDSGGGFIVQNNNKWYLRGIVSSSLVDKNKSTCDVANYAVYTDITNFTAWIEKFIGTHG